MTVWTKLLLAAVVGYCMGCIHPAMLIAKCKGASIRSVGNGNSGASNIALNYGIKAGVLVGAVDILKALLPCLLVAYLLHANVYLQALAGCCAVMGHMFPLPAKFHGGKGFASFIGMSVALNWKVALAILLIAVALALLADYIVVATFTMALAVPWCFIFLMGSCVGLMVSLVACIIVAKHHRNIVQLCKGTEPYISDLWKK